MSYPRPVSPHLSVYKPQDSSLASIFNRITGSLLTLGLYIFVLILSIYSLNWKICFIPLFKLSLFFDFVTLSILLFICYHTINSLRSIITWNFELKGIVCEKRSRYYLPHLTILFYLLLLI